MSTSSSEFDAIVVGAGALGLSISRALADKGISVACIGPHHTTPGTASSAAGAMLSPFAEVTRDLRGEQAWAEVEFRARAAALYQDFVNSLSEETKLPITLGAGTFVIATLTYEWDRQNIKAIAEAAHKFDAPTESVSPEDIPGSDPARGYEPVEALFLPTEKWVNSAELLTALAASVNQREKAVLIPEKVEKLLHNPQRQITGVQLSDGSEILAPQVVLAAGIGVQHLVDKLNSEVGADGPTANLPPMLAGKGMSLVVSDPPEPFPHVIRTPNRFFGCGVHVVPRGDNGLYLGATNWITVDEEEAAEVRIGEVYELFYSLINEINVYLAGSPIVSMTYGYRPLTADRYPVIGRSDFPGLFLATGTYRNGVLMAPLIADIIAQEITGQTLNSEGNPFSPKADFRTAGAASEQEVAEKLEEGWQLFTSALLHPGGKLPFNRYGELGKILSALDVNSVRDPQQRAELKALLEKYPMPEMAQNVYRALLLS